MPQSHRLFCINLSRDLCLKLIERRGMAPDQLTSSMRFLSVAAENLVDDIEAGSGLHLVKFARDITIKLIELGLVNGVQAAAQTLAETGHMVAEVAALLSPDLAEPALKTARDLTLKLLETGRLSRTSLPALFEELAISVAEKTVNGHQ